MTTATAPTQESTSQKLFPPQGQWTYEHWLRFPDDGWTYEIIDGVLHMAPPPAVAHQSASINLAARMYQHAQDNDLGQVLTAPCGVRLPGQDVPVEPDILFIQKARLDIIGQQYVEGAPDLIVEIISPSRVSYDRQTKFRLYEAAGVAEYWLVDYQARTVETFTLHQGAYQQQGHYTAEAGHTIPATHLSGFSIEAARLFEGR